MFLEEMFIPDDYVVKTSLRKNQAKPIYSVLKKAESLANEYFSGSKVTVDEADDITFIVITAKYADDLQSKMNKLDEEFWKEYPASEYPNVNFYLRILD